MNTTPHTQEPWAVWIMGKSLVITATGKDRPHPNEGMHIATVKLPDSNRNHDHIFHANAERIAACVNGCAGVADPSAIPGVIAALKALVSRIQHYSATPSDQRPFIEQWEYTDGSTDMAEAVSALKKAEGVSHE